MLICVIFNCLLLNTFLNANLYKVNKMSLYNDLQNELPDERNNVSVSDHG